MGRAARNTAWGSHHGATPLHLLSLLLASPWLLGSAKLRLCLPTNTAWGGTHNKPEPPAPEASRCHVLDAHGQLTPSTATPTSHCRHRDHYVPLRTEPRLTTLLPGMDRQVDTKRAYSAADPPAVRCRTRRSRQGRAAGDPMPPAANGLWGGYNLLAGAGWLKTCVCIAAGSPARASLCPQ